MEGGGPRAEVGTLLTVHFKVHTLFFFYKNVVFPAQAKYS